MMSTRVCFWPATPHPRAIWLLRLLPRFGSSLRRVDVCGVVELLFVGSSLIFRRCCCSSLLSLRLLLFRCCCCPLARLISWFVLCSLHRRVFGLQDAEVAPDAATPASKDNAVIEWFLLRKCDELVVTLGRFACLICLFLFVLRVADGLLLMFVVVLALVVAVLLWLLLFCDCLFLLLCCRCCVLLCRCCHSCFVVHCAVHLAQPQRAQKASNRLVSPLYMAPVCLAFAVDVVVVSFCCCLFRFVCCVCVSWR